MSGGALVAALIGIVWYLFVAGLFAAMVGNFVLDGRPAWPQGRAALIGWVLGLLWPLVIVGVFISMISAEIARMRGESQ